MWRFMAAAASSRFLSGLLSRQGETAAQAAENEACQLQQDNKGVVIVYEGQVHLEFEGDRCAE